VYNRQKQRRQNPNNRNDYEQFDQRETFVRGRMGVLHKRLSIADGRSWFLDEPNPGMSLGKADSGTRVSYHESSLATTALAD
jgi:hypothetical protein